MTLNHSCMICGVHKNKVFVILGIGAMLVLTMVVSQMYQNRLISAPTLTEAAARSIAETTCIKGGESLAAGSYNEVTKTWWFDANLNATQQGCNPACVVSEETNTAEINWRCTGLIPPDQTDPNTPPTLNQCGIENCHGLEIVCGDNPAQMCTEIYMLGDRCRQFAECEVVDGNCQQSNNPLFFECKTCVEKCEKDFPDDPEMLFACESECGE